MTYTALFLDREQKIRANVFPEPPDRSKMQGLKYSREIIRWRDKVQSALDTGILCEDQEEALRIGTPKNWEGPPDIKYWMTNVPYRVNYRMEVKEQWWAINEWIDIDPTTDEFFRKDRNVSRRKLATLKPII